MIDLKPAVGRIVVRQSIMRDEYFRRGGVITKLTHFSIFYKATENSPVVFTKRRTGIAAICDTQDEADKLLAFDREMRERRTLAKKQERLELKRRFGL